MRDDRLSDRRLVLLLRPRSHISSEEKGKNSKKTGAYGDNFKRLPLISYGIRLYRHGFEEYCYINRVSASSGGIRTSYIDLRLFSDKIWNGVHIT